MYICSACGGCFPVEKMAKNCKRRDKISLYCRTCYNRQQKENIKQRKESPPESTRNAALSAELDKIENILLNGTKAMIYQKFEALCRRRNELLIKNLQRETPVWEQDERLYQVQVINN